jgi:myo-inositol-1(or 4)-monophosphatase
MSIYLTVAKKAARLAGAMTAGHYRKYDRADTRFKKNNERVTVLDLAAEKIIIKEIKRNFPSHSFLSEEAGHSKRYDEYVWIIDPIDGTNNFILANPIFGVSIALVYKKEIIMGVSYFPILRRMFWAEKGKGAYLNNKKIKVSQVTSINHAAHSFDHGQTARDIRLVLKLYGKFLPRHIRVRHLGSTALELAQVASGNLDSNITVGIGHLWDVAAGICLIREAGGVVTDGNGEPWNFRSSSLLAANSKLHSKLVKFIALKG